MHNVLSSYPTRYNMHALQTFIKQKRKSSKLTQVVMAKKAGVGLRFVRELEQGKTSLRMDKVNQVLWLFGAELVPGKIPIPPVGESKTQREPTGSSSRQKMDK